MSPWFAMVLAPTLQPWTLIGAGAATVVEAKLSSWESFLALLGYCVLASASYLAMEIYAIIRPGQSRALLARFRTWINTRTDQVIIVGSLIGVVRLRQPREHRSRLLTSSCGAPPTERAVPGLAEPDKAKPAVRLSRGKRVPPQS